MSIYSNYIQPSFNESQNGSSYLDYLTNKYIIKPKSIEGINGFVFDYEAETSLQYQADITDHYTESNLAIQDHMAIKPIKISMRGFVNELVYNAPKIGVSPVTVGLEILQNSLTTVPAYLGGYTGAQTQNLQKLITQTQNIVNRIDQTAQRIENMAGLFDKSVNSETKQQKAYIKLSGMFNKRIIFTLQTPYDVFDNMIIETLSFVQPEDTKYETDISITLKQLRFAQVIRTTFNNNLFAGRAGSQSQDETNNGKTKGENASIWYNNSKKSGFLQAVQNTGSINTN